MIIYHNLTQCDAGLRFTYFRSTDVEQHNYHRLLWSVPDELLYFLSKGEQIYIVDITSNKNGGKIKRIFCPVLSDTLNSLYFKSPLMHPALIAHTDMALTAIEEDTSLKTKFMFWKDKINNKVDISGISVIAQKEPNPLTGRR